MTSAEAHVPPPVQAGPGRGPAGRLVEGKRKTSYLPDFNPYLCVEPLDYSNPEPKPEHAGKALREVYEASCNAHACRKNTWLLDLLPTSASQDLEELDLSLNFVGRLGLRPVLDVVRCCRTLACLSFADNFLDNSSVVEIAGAIDGCTTVRELNLSRNPISQSGGKHLNSLVRNNANIVSVSLQDTLINPALQAAILRKAHANSLLTPDERALRLKQQAALRKNHRVQQQFRLRKTVDNDGQDSYGTLACLASEHDTVDRPLHHLSLLVEAADEM